MELLPKSLARPAGRLVAVAQNALEVARFGGLETDEIASPFAIAAEQRNYRLRHYFPADDGPPVLLVPPLMLAAEVYDVSPATSGVAVLHEHGIDPWVVDFGAPEHEPGGLERTLADHVLAVSDAVDRVREATGQDVHLAGYSQGGMFVYQAAAYRRSEGLSSLITFGSPVDTRAGLPFGIPAALVEHAAGLLADGVGSVWVPAWVSSVGFRLLDPVKALRAQVEFILQLHDREALLPRERQRRFLGGEGFVAWPGPALADFMRQFVAHNRMLEGGFVIEDRLVTLADIETPILSFVGTVDEIAPASGVRAISQAAPRAEIYEVALAVGHFGLVVGSTSTRATWPTVAAWAHWRRGAGELPNDIEPILDDGVEARGPAMGSRVGYGLELATGVGVEVTRSLVGTGVRTLRGVRELTREAAGQLPRLARLEQIQPGTRISIGLLVEELERRAANDVFFLWEGRAYTTAQVAQRIDNVVRGLIAIGVRQGEHVGVLMGTRPSALAVVVALNRLGAVAVLLRPEGDLAREVELGGVACIVADPERAAAAAGSVPGRAFVLGGGGEPRDLGVAGVLDMEQIDPETVELPKWYRANSARARDLAFILFTGSGAQTRMSAVTNRRWALSAVGTASSAALSGADTVYSVAPVHHPSGLMMSVGGAIAGGARLAMATRLDPGTFWEEVRRYGVTVASYTWTMLHDLVEAPPDPGERHHPLRLFIGAGMPRGLWRRVQDRFAPARVLEFYASTEAGAILVNLRGTKPGSLGRPLPGSAQVRIAAYDVAARELILGPDGFTRRCERGEVGLLLARVGRAARTGGASLRGVFARDDAWVSTGDLFRIDSDGDYWRLDAVTEAIVTADGVVYTVPICDALADIPAVDLAVAYGVPADDGRFEIAVAAMTLRAGRELRAREVTAALAGLEPEERPAVVHVVDKLPVTTWYRPVTGALREAGIAGVGEGWYRERGGDGYRMLTEEVRRDLDTGCTPIFKLNRQHTTRAANDTTIRSARH